MSGDGFLYLRQKESLSPQSCLCMSMNDRVSCLVVIVSDQRLCNPRDTRFGVLGHN